MKDNYMKQILIDKFLVPQNAIEEFTNRMNYNRNLIKNFPGFIGDKVYRRTDDDGKSVIITIAEWEDENYISKAKEAVQKEYKKIGFDIREMITRLNIFMERGIYQEIQGTTIDKPIG